MTEDQLEQEALGWLKSLGYDYRFGPDITFDGPTQSGATIEALFFIDSSKWRSENTIRVSP